MQNACNKFLVIYAVTKYCIIKFLFINRTSLEVLCAILNVGKVQILWNYSFSHCQHSRILESQNVKWLECKDYVRT